jgi:DNA (cytosine-5)-methyltransferase 1
VEAFESDKRHFLYTEYLRIIRLFGPSVFVMENVKGMLNSKHGGTPIFERILADLRSPGNGTTYVVRSLVVDGDEPEPLDYLIESEKYGVPQCRHRVILFGVRSDLRRHDEPRPRREVQAQAIEQEGQRGVSALGPSRTAQQALTEGRLASRVAFGAQGGA